jgi:hypothetical protein
MRPSEFKSAAGQAPIRKLKFPIDVKADPPISFEEALAAGAANCPRHGGIIGQRGDRPGMVFLCTPCGMYWRYLKGHGPSRKRLTYPKRDTFGA